MPTVAASPALAIPNAPMKPMNAALAAQRARLCRTTTGVGEGAAWLEVTVIGFLIDVSPGNLNPGRTAEPQTDDRPLLRGRARRLLKLCEQ